MAKSSKVEDYWRQNNVESLLKELTQLLARRMPPDPAIAIVEHLQKKFPKSFKTSSDNINVFSKTLTNNLPVQAITSPHSDLQNESINDVQTERRSSNQSQISGIVTIPTVNSAFTNLLKQDVRLAPEISIKNIVFANRLSQQAFKMGKDIRSDRDILDEEVIKPTKTKAIDSTSEDLNNIETQEEPSVLQIIKYKQQIRMGNDRRVHREKLAALAKYQSEKEQFIQSDLGTKPEETEQQKLEDDESSTQIVPSETKTDRKLSHQPIAKSKEEEEILNDENVFQPRKQRDRGRPRNKLLTPRSNTPYTRAQPVTNSGVTMKRADETIICKVCGNAVNGEDNQRIVYSQQNSASLTARLIQPQFSARSVESTSDAVDDWFEPTSDTSGPRQSSPRTLDDAISPPTGSTTFRRSLFQPIDDRVEHRPPIRPSIPTDDDNETKTKRLTTPRLSESGIFSRSSDPKIRRPSPTRSIPSPIPKKHQTETVAMPSNQLANTLPQPTPTNNRIMSGWSVREHSPDDSNEN